MSSRNRRRGGGSVAASGSPEIERLLAKGRVKDAFKQAKLSFRQQATPENRRLLERTYLLRIKDLARGGMPAAAAEVARAFLEFGVSEPDAVGELAAVLPRLGMIEEARRLAPRLQSSVAATTLEQSLADQAVLHPEHTATPEVKLGAERVRSALAALDAEQEEQAMALLQDIPRSSPFADWRYFARGLAAYRRGDESQAAANFNHLDPRRAAHRIATRLGTAAAAGKQQGERENADSSAVEAAVFGQPVLARLDRVRRLVDRGNPKYDWKQALPLIGTLTATLRRVDPRLAERLTEILLPPLFDEVTTLSVEGAHRLIEGFKRVAVAWRLDPAWNRFWALCCEQAAGSLRAVDFWKKYLGDLEHLANLAVDQRRRVQAMVWRHIGELLAEQARADTPAFFESEAPPSSELQDDAVQALEASLQADPSQRETHALLISLFDERDLPERAAEARTRLLQNFPDDFETLKELIFWHFTNDEPEQSLAYAVRARKLRPLDVSLIGDERAALLGVARHRALAGRFDEARALFSRAEALDPKATNEFDFLARRAICELKAGEQAKADELIARAQSLLADAAPLWLVVSAEAERYKLGASRIKEFNQRLNDALKKRKHGETAAQLARFISAYDAANVNYAHKKQHLAAVTKYVRATSRTRYSLDDLERVCEFLQRFEGEDPLLSKLIARGLRQFPQSPLFQLLRVDEELPSVPAPDFNFKGLCERLEKALKLAEAGGQEGRYLSLIEPLKRNLALAERMREASESMRGMFGGRGGLPNFFRMMESMLNNEDDEYDDGPFDEDFFEPPFSFEPQPRRGRKSK